jgi:hypothetical protein
VLYLPAKARVKGSAKTRGKAVSAKSVKRAPVKAAAKKKPVKRARQ